MNHINEIQQDLKIEPALILYCHFCPDGLKDKPVGYLRSEYIKPSCDRCHMEKMFALEKLERKTNPQKFLVGTGVEKAELEFSFENFKEREKSIAQLAELKQYAYREKLNDMLIQGECGNGKTHLCVAIMRELIKRGCTSSKMHYFVESGMHRHLLHFAFDLPKLKFHFEKIVNYEFLLLDDLGRTKLTDTAKKYTIDVLDDRQRKGKTTLITMNKKLDQIKTIYGDPLYDRLKDYELIVINLSSYRGKNGA